MDTFPTKALHINWQPFINLARKSAEKHKKHSIYTRNETSGFTHKATHFPKY